MLKYTRASIAMIANDLKIIRNIIKYASLIISIAYYAYAAFVPLGVLSVDITLAVVLFVYGIFEIATMALNIDHAKRVVRHIYHAIRIALKAFVLGTVIYGMYVATLGTVSPIAIIWATLMIVMWVIEVIAEFALIIFEREKDILLEGVEQDLNDAKDVYRKPVQKVTGFFHRLKGDYIEEEEEPEKSKTIQKLDKFIAKRKRQKAERKRAEKEAKEKEKQK